MAENKLEIVISAKGAPETADNLIKLEKALSTLDASLKGFKTGSFDKIVTEFNKLSSIKVPKTLTDNLNSLSGAVANLAFIPNTDKIEQIGRGISSLNGVKVGKTLGDSLGNISESVNKFDSNVEVKGLTDVMKSLEGLNEVKISKTLGTGLEGITTALNNITNVKEINPQLATNLDTLGKSLQSFRGLENIQFSGVAQLTTALTQIGKIKPISDNIYKNVDKIANAVNSLNTQLGGIDDKRLKALASVTRAVAPSMKQAEQGTKQWGNSLKVLNLEAFVNLLQKAIRAMKEFVDLGSKAAFEYAKLQNSMSFYNQSLGSYAREQMQILQGYADLGLIDMDDALQKIAAMNNMLIGFGHNKENAAKMSRILYQVAADASFSIGENGKDVEAKFGNLMSAMEGMPRSLYDWGIDTTVTAMIDGFDEATRSMTKLEKSTYAYMMVMQGTKIMQGQLSREFNLAATQQYILQNKIKQSLASLGKVIQPVFLEIIKYAFIALRAVEMLMSALFKDYEQINFETMLGGMEVVNSAENATGGMAQNMQDSAKSAKEMKKYLAGFDDLNVMSITDTSSDAKDSIGGLPEGFDFGDYNLAGAMQEEMSAMFKEIDEQAEKLYETLKKIAPWVIGIGLAFLTWKIATGFAMGINALTTLFGGFGGSKKGIKQLEDMGTGLASKKLISTVKNIGLGVVVLGELAGAAILLTGAIWVLGKELEQVGIAWQPVIENGATIAIAMGIGTLLIAGIGGATYLLGTVGTSVALNIGIGALVMLEIGIATGLFLIEIIAVGKLLQEVYNAWLPINDKAGPIASYIGIGTGLLLGIGIVTAALGALTVASVGTLPLAIGLGTKMLFALTDAFVAFVSNLKTTAKQIIELDKAFDPVNPILPITKEKFKVFNKEMVGIASLIADFSKNQAITGFQSVVSNIVSFFSKSPIATHAKEIEKQGKDTQKLYNNLLVANINLRKTITELEENIRLMEEYTSLSSQKTGGGIVTNIGKGIANGVSKASGFVSRATNTLVESMKEELEINSKSKVMQDEVGYFMGTGIGKGILNAIPQVVKDTKKLSNSIPQLQFDNIDSGFTTMLIDWKGLWSQAWEDMADTASLSLKNINTPVYDMSSMYATVRSQSNNGDVTSVLREVVANIIQAIYDSKDDDDGKEPVMVLDGKVLGRFYDEYVEDRNARAGRTVIR